MLFMSVNLLRQVVYMYMKYEQLITDSHSVKDGCKVVARSIITAGYFTVLV